MSNETTTARTRAQKLRAWLADPQNLLDLHTYGGLLLAGVGVGAIYLPAAPILVGAGLFYLATRRA